MRRGSDQSTGGERAWNGLWGGVLGVDSGHDGLGWLLGGVDGGGGGMRDGMGWEGSVM